ncbi:MAG: hypothetical protein ACI865_003202 [Flavobacteriaceae bacterium]
MKEIVLAPVYSWFAPFSFDHAALMIGMEGELSKDDSLEVLGLMEEMSSYDEGGVIYAPKDKKHKVFIGIRVAALGLMYDDRDLSKVMMTSLLETELGESLCSISMIGPEPPFPFYCV